MRSSWSWSKTKRWLECPSDENAVGNTTWCNRDLVPIPPSRRTYGPLSYFGYWSVCGVCMTAWSTGSTLLSYGLSPKQAIGCLIVGGFLTGLLTVVCGWVGVQHHIGFTVTSRANWGMRGSYFPVIIRSFIAFMWFGMQAYWGGQATQVMIGAIIPGFAHMKNFFSENSHLKTNDFIGLIIWMCGFVPGILIRPEKLQIPFFVCFISFSGSCIGLLIWSTTRVHGGGSLFHEPTQAPNLGWAFMFGITAILGSWGSGVLGQSDWTRYAMQPFAPTLSQVVATPMSIAATASIGVVVTSASHDILGGQLQWNPIYLLSDIQEHYHSSPRVRAAVFFGALGVVLSQYAVSIVLNSVSCGMDLAGLWPRYINIRRGAYIMCILGIATQPWELLASASKFLTVLSGFGVFIAPACGILCSDYLLVRRRKLNLPDLYTGNSSSVYWFHSGINWRAVITFAASFWIFVPGLAAATNGYKSAQWTGWSRLYNLTYLVGFFLSFALFTLLNWIWPVPGKGQDVPFSEYLDSFEPGVPTETVFEEKV